MPLPRPGLLRRLRSMDRAFWCANAMEVLERWAFYGVRSLLSLYIVDAASRGGLEFNHLQKGTLYSWWALIQCLLPVFTGGFSDRYGFKRTIALSTLMAASAYLLMGWQRTYWGFFASCMLLASATALFKPGLQGTIGRSLREGHASFGWGLFYLMANTGGFLGPWAAGCLRLLAWRYVFFMSAAAVLANLLVLLAYDEPQAAAAPPPRAGENLRILLSSLRGLREPRLLAFLLLFSGYWVMFMQLFDILPNFIDDWVDSSALVGLAGRLLGVRRLVEASAAGRCIPPEWLINLNSALIILLMIPVSTLTARVSVPSSIAAGTLLASAGMILAGSSMNAWLCVAGIAVFSLGEMAAGPKLPEYLCALAPPEKKGLYMGYASLPLAVGWALGSRLGGFLYENCADKTRFARGLLVTDFGVSPEAASALAKGAVLPELAARMGSTQEQATRELFLRLKPWRIWPAFALIALASAAGLALYERRYGGRASGRRVC